MINSWAGRRACFIEPAGVGIVTVSVAQWIAHRTSNPGVVGSSPTVDALFGLLEFFLGTLNHTESDY